MKELSCIVLMMLLLVGCKKQTLNSLAFPSEKLDAYEFENYAEPELKVPDTYTAGLQQTLITLTSVDKESGETYQIYGLYLGDMSTIATDTVIYFCHGQSKHMDYYWTRAALIAHTGGKHNYGVFMIDYRGYGMSEGTSTEHGLIEDADAGLDWLIEKGLTADRCVYYGFSLGAIPMIERTAYRTDFVPSKLICESPLASVQNLTQNATMLNVDANFVTELVFDNAENIKSVNVPYFWIHGVNDTYVAIQNGELIYSNYKGPYQQALRVEGADHADIPTVYGLEAYIDQFLAFIRL